MALARRPQPTLLPLLAALSACLLSLSCQEEQAVVPEDGLTPEERALNAALSDPDLFDVPEIEEEEEFQLNKSSQVSILCYHDFAERATGTEMIMPVEKFREQMQAIKDSDIPVIPLSDVRAWQRGDQNIPDAALVITIDDGWVGTHSHALPILKEFGFPFTLYLYTRYVAIGGRSLSIDQIHEIIANGGEIGSHSISHADLRARGGRSEQAWREWVSSELIESKRVLEERLGIEVTSFAYPFGTWNDEVVELAREAGYDNAVTVGGSKVGWDTAPHLLGRFIIHGNGDQNFKIATSFRGQAAALGSNLLAASATGDAAAPKAAAAAPEAPPISVTPTPDSTITERLPLIQVDLSRLEGVDPASIRMEVSGFGTVPASYDAASGLVTYQIPQRLRRSDCQVVLRFQREGESQPDVVPWRFFIDHLALYLGADAPAQDSAEQTGSAADAAPLEGVPESAPPAVPLPPGAG